MTYKWDTPYEWFESYVDTLSWQETRVLLLQFALAAGNDAIHDMFQSSMQQDEYFEDEESPNPYMDGYNAGYSDAEEGKAYRKNPYGGWKDTDSVQFVNACAWRASYDEGGRDYALEIAQDFSA